MHFMFDLEKYWYTLDVSLEENCHTEYIWKQELIYFGRYNKKNSNILCAHHTQWRIQDFP